MASAARLASHLAEDKDIRTCERRQPSDEDTGQSAGYNSVMDFPSVALVTWVFLWLESIGSSW